MSDNALAEVADSVSRHPYMVAGGVAAILLLGMIGSRKPAAPGELSDDIKKSLIEADVQSQQIDAAARIANGQAKAGVQTAVAQARAGVAMAGIQANADQFGMRQSTIQNRESVKGQTAIARMELKSATDLANINSVLQRQLQAADLQWQSWKAQYDDAYQRWELPRLLEYYSAQDMLAYKQARATAPYYAQQTQWLVRHGISPTSSPYGFSNSFGTTAGQSLGSQVGPIVQSIIGAVASYFGGSAGAPLEVERGIVASRAQAVPQVPPSDPNKNGGHAGTWGTDTADAITGVGRLIKGFMTYGISEIGPLISTAFQKGNYFENYFRPDYRRGY